jgi:hypothetical protein
MTDTTPEPKKNSKQLAKQRRKLRKRARQINRYGVRNGLSVVDIKVTVNEGMWERWREMEERLGVERGVLVQTALEEFMSNRGIDWVMELGYPDRGIHE